MKTKTGSVQVQDKVIAGRVVKVATSAEVKKATSKTISKYRKTLEALKDR
ncbi:hypothetical protein MO867_09405 [Microbulbifer sp. OS29]|uniref:Uncharacterized protein n=1 Tax=Microbulbifer okhotskensis TaxID=2926617 RepID=A0A9X2EMS8_9GAMM|nr:hypothetical protein [Microbulbifer okhotskensis]MCO1334554.1 hypothetical protein [Microbulbifer okhotskensis]